MYKMVISKGLEQHPNWADYVRPEKGYLRLDLDKPLFVSDFGGDDDEFSDCEELSDLLDDYAVGREAIIVVEADSFVYWEVLPLPVLV